MYQPLSYYILSVVCILILSNIPSTYSQSTITSYDCVDPNNREVTHQVRKGDITTVCLYVGPNGDWNNNIDYKRFSVNLIADEFSSYDVPGSFTAIVGENGEKEKATFNTNADAAHIFAASQSSLSFLRRYYDSTSQRIYPFLTAVVDVEEGVVRGIAWDDACVFCEKSQCVANTYNFDGSLATSDQINQLLMDATLVFHSVSVFKQLGNTACDLKLYVVWTGTDVDGKSLLSSDSRFSMFPPNRLQENVQGQVNNMIDSFKNLGKQVGIGN